MGQKTNPIGLRLGIVKTWDSRWFARKNYADLLSEDIKVRKYLLKRLSNAAVSKVVIQRAANKVTVNIATAKPGLVIGRRGSQVDQLRDELNHLTGKEIYINIDEIKKPDVDASLVAQNIARQLEGRVSFRRAMKKAIQAAMRSGAEGIRVHASGRLGGAEMARSESYREGRVPLHTLRADIDFARATAFTTYGTCGVKVWVFHGEILPGENLSGNTKTLTKGAPAAKR
ncbi:MAG: 30S ribosomal protein S3 [Candidatus Eisenbacteria bacterium]|uniref:Small ribosomal subunit protein uS3 n=1 Tax=Eiseniibacteriota bacterium TaxID=2212470 RepID=A0A7Y2E688_UNCEI|nr:30S ribosomal protein S3 [Candidatus Eisenbacteria bacterium]